MARLFENIDTLSTPYEAFWVDSRNQNTPTRPHWHYYIELIYVEGGELSVECDNHRAILHGGDCAVFHPKQIHTITPMSADYRYGVLKFDVSRLNISSLYTPKLRVLMDDVRTNRDISPFVSAELLQDGTFRQTFAACISELEARNYGYDLVVHAGLCSLLVTLLRIWRAGGAIITAKGSPSGEAAIDSITEYIDEHANEPLRAQALADRCGMSYSYFARSFKQRYGRSCKEYIEFIRVSKAEDLLLFTDYDLNYISQETGFSDCSHLIKTFRKWKSVTPKQYRLRSTLNPWGRG